MTKKEYIFLLKLQKNGYNCIVHICASCPLGYGSNGCHCWNDYVGRTPQKALWPNWKKDYIDKCIRDYKKLELIAELVKD